jgi:hypothetical protein
LPNVENKWQYVHVSNRAIFNHRMFRNDDNPYITVKIEIRAFALESIERPVCFRFEDCPSRRHDFQNKFSFNCFVYLILFRTNSTSDASTTTGELVRWRLPNLLRGWKSETVLGLMANFSRIRFRNFGHGESSWISRPVIFSTFSHFKNQRSLPLTLEVAKACVATCLIRRSSVYNCLRTDGYHKLFVDGDCRKALPVENDAGLLIKWPFD